MIRKLALSLRHASRRIAVGVVLSWSVAVPGAEPEPQLPVMTSVEQAQQALSQVAQERSLAVARRRAALAECATRVMVNRCSAAVESAHRQTNERLRQIERRAREFLREDRSQRRVKAEAERRQRAAERHENAPQREEEGRDRERAREVSREERMRERQAREASAAQNAARYEARQRARAEREAAGSAGMPDGGSVAAPGKGAGP